MKTGLNLDNLNPSENDFFDIPGCNGFYQTNAWGVIRSIDRIITTNAGFEREYKGLVLKQSIAKSGYFVCGLSIDVGKNTIKTVHRMVALTLIVNPENLPQVNHIDTNKLNNYYKNLEWCTNEYNSQHAVKNGLRKYKNGEDWHAAKLSDADIIKIRSERNLGISVVNIASKYNVSTRQIYDIINFKQRLQPV